jgi:hypothetical protein
MELVSLKTAHGWRDATTKDLIKHYGNRVKIINPCKTESKKLAKFGKSWDDKDVKELLKKWKKTKNWPTFLKVMDQIEKFDIADIGRSCAIIAFLDFKTLSGAYSEIWEAYRVAKIPVYAFTIADLSGANSWSLATTMLANPRKKIYYSREKVLQAVFKDFKREPKCQKKKQK